MSATKSSNGARIAIALGAATSVVCLALALRSIDWSRTGAVLRGVDPVLLIAGSALLVVMYFILALRWRVLLSSHVHVPARAVFTYVMIGYLANSVLPLRLGEVVRATLMGRRARVSKVLVLGSIVLDRTLDVLTLLAFAVVTSLFVHMPPAVRASVVIIGGAGFIALIGLMIVARSAAALERLHARFAHVALVDRLIGPGRIVPRFAMGLSTLRDGRQLAEAAALSLAAWGVSALASMAYIMAFHLPVPWVGAIVVLVVINLGGAIPSSPGAIGVYHFLAVLALSIWVSDKSSALAYAIGTHAASMVLNIAIGTVCLLREGLSLRSLSHATEQPT